METNSLHTLAVLSAPEDIHDLGLFLQSQGIPHRRERINGGVRFVIPHSHLEPGIESLAQFKEERAWRKSQPAEPQVIPSNFRLYPSIVGGLIALALFHTLTGLPIPGFGYSVIPWDRLGAVDSARIFGEGEWWRIFTALTLHSGAAHILSNLITGGFFLNLLAAQIPAGWAAGLTILCGGIGNLINAAVKYPEHLSLGASTAVFAAIGILCGRQIASQSGWRGLVLPIGGAIGLLGMLGAGGGDPRVDVSAHMFGLFVGLGGGYVFALANRRFDLEQYSTYAGVFAIVLIALAWALAI